jgi:SAM-dependent methyltransferase
VHQTSLEAKHELATNKEQIMMTAEMETLKTRLKSTWMSGNYAAFAKPIEPGALEFLARLEVTPGMKVLDVGCGAGQIAIPAARAGAVVTGVDIAVNSLEQARLRALNENLNVQFDEGDAELLPYEDASFDLVVSLLGAMFAPRPDRVATELTRVCKPGGRIALANWTPEGFIGQMFKIIGKHVPPSPLMPSPLLWGKEEVVRERFNTGITELRLTKLMYPFHYQLNPAEVVEFYRQHYGPMNRAFAGLDEAAQTALRHDLEAFWSDRNEATDSTMRYVSEYLEIIAVRA